MAQLEAQKNMSADTTPLGPFAGINNRLPDHKLGIVSRGQKAGDYQRNAVNVDLTAAGTLKRRKGTTLALAGADCHSLWADEQGAYFVDGGDLKTFPAGEVVRSGLTPGRRVSFARFSNGDLYWSNGVVLERIRDGVSEPAGLPVPDAAPSVAGASGGALPAGWYQVAITLESPDGEESGSSWPVAVQVSENGVLEVSTLPAGTKRIYVSPCNGDVLFHAVTTTASTYRFPVTPQQGAQLQTLGFRPMPAGSIVRVHNGRLLTADRNGLYYSEPYAPTWHNPLRGYIPLPGITLVEPMQAGIYITTGDRTYWLAGADIAGDAALVDLLPYGAAAGSSTRINNALDVAWYSQRGIVIGSRDGQVKNMQEDTTATEKASRAAMLYREQDGMRQLVSSLFGAEATVAAASTYFEAELVRKENML